MTLLAYAMAYLTSSVVVVTVLSIATRLGPQSPWWYGVAAALAAVVGALWYTLVRDGHQRALAMVRSLMPMRRRSQERYTDA